MHKRAISWISSYREAFSDIFFEVILAQLKMGIRIDRDSSESNIFIIITNNKTKRIVKESKGLEEFKPSYIRFSVS